VFDISSLLDSPHGRRTKTDQNLRILSMCPCVRERDQGIWRETSTSSVDSAGGDRAASGGARAGLPVGAALVFRRGGTCFQAEAGRETESGEDARQDDCLSVGAPAGGAAVEVCRREAAGTLAIFLDANPNCSMRSKRENRKRRGLRLGGKRKSAEPVQLMRWQWLIFIKIWFSTRRKFSLELLLELHYGMQVPFQILFTPSWDSALRSSLFQNPSRMYP
jgi:hypothetical protein